MRIYKIVIADDHQIVASAMRRLVESFAQCEVLYTVSNGKELLDRFANAKNIPDLVLLDISMPVMDGFKTMEALSRDYPDVKVLGLSMAENEAAFLKLIELGAHGFFPKMDPEDQLEGAIKTIMTKGVYYSDEVTAALFRMLKERNSIQNTDLSPREKELLTYIGTELTYSDIAEAMEVSPKTIDNYRTSLFQKLNVNSRTTLALYAYVNGYFKR